MECLAGRYVHMCLQQTNYRIIYLKREWGLITAVKVRKQNGDHALASQSN